ncbi:MAG: hypothetical protein LUE31_02800 [Lachnospiraceae bacterium]|nr:hypothetical protein [Lachnospiraceae bacterium]
MEDNELEKQLKKLRRDLRVNRIISIVSVLLTVCLLGALVWVAGTLEPVVEQVSQLDIDTVNSTLTEAESVLTEISASDIDWEQLSGTIAGLDVDTLNETMRALDMEQLTEAIENLNEASEAIQELADSLNSSLFGMFR